MHQFDTLDPDRDFAGGELCRDGSLNPASFVNPVVNPLFGPVAENIGPFSYSFHPNAIGHRAYEQALARRLKQDISTTVTVAPREEVSAGTVFVPYGARVVHADTSWPGSTVTLRLESPGGQVYDGSTEGVRGGATATSQGWRSQIPRPAAGRSASSATMSSRAASRCS